MHTAVLILAIAALCLEALRLFVALFGPELRYLVEPQFQGSLDSPEFTKVLAVLTDAAIHLNNSADVLTNGTQFYEAELAAIRSASRSIHLEAYIFHRGSIGRRFVEALTERALAGVQVKVIADYIGCLSTPRSYFRDLLQAGGRLKWYHPIRLSLLFALNNRTHRELLVIDGRVGFVGGAGIGDQWLGGIKGDPQWRDTVLRVEGPVVSSLQSVFAENWLRVAGEILAAGDYYRFESGSGNATALIVNSTPAAGSTRARILFQLLISCAQSTISISTPYFLPDRSARHALIRAMKDRGVEVTILTPGVKSDNALTRASSRHLYGALLRNGAKIYEYKPSMIHVKALMVDGLWVVVGSTNFDHRSFEINDEVNLAVQNTDVTRRLKTDFECDLKQSELITYENWRKKMRFRILEHFEFLLERQE